jgi:16S rRNA (cytosine967-C5)-methyltransferase
VEKICRSFLEERPLTVRVREQEAGTGSFQSRLPQGCTAEKSGLAPDAWYLKGVSHLPSLPDFQSGALYAQDVSSMLAVRAAGIRPGSRVLDMCAAPGGKSILAADLMREEALPGERAGIVISRDVTERKLALLRENRERCHISEMQPCLWDATQFRQEDREAFDVVIADVPCSGYGVIGRKPDIRYHASAEKEASLAELQKKILANAVRCVRPGGTLLFSTCTINRTENEDNTAWLLQHFPMEKKEERQLLPGSYPGDGFYYAVFRV